MVKKTILIVGLLGLVGIVLYMHFTSQVTFTTQTLESSPQYQSGALYVQYHSNDIIPTRLFDNFSIQTDSVQSYQTYLDQKNTIATVAINARASTNITTSATVVQMTHSVMSAVVKNYQIYEVNNVYKELDGASSFSNSNLNNFYILKFDENEDIDAIIHILEKDPLISYVSKVPLYTTMQSNINYPNDPKLGRELTIVKAIDAMRIHGVTGKRDIKIAIVDDAIDITHPELAGNVVDSRDVTRNDKNPRPGNSTQTHGTHTAGSAIGSTNNGVGFASIGGGVGLIAIKAAYDREERSLGRTCDGVTKAVALGADIISMSFGGGGSDGCINNLAKQYPDILFIAAAGNFNLDAGSFSPCNGSHVKCIGATGKSDEQAFFGNYRDENNQKRLPAYSNYGSVVDVSAPGISILSSIPGNGYASYQGTSMATPLVASFAGLLMSQGLTASQARDLIIQTKDPILWQGGGRINVLKAVEALKPRYGCKNTGANSAVCEILIGGKYENAFCDNSCGTGKDCYNGILDSAETDVDCGGSCAPCANEKKCNTNGDCSSNYCDVIIGGDTRDKFLSLSLSKNGKTYSLEAVSNGDTTILVDILGNDSISLSEITKKINDTGFVSFLDSNNLTYLAIVSQVDYSNLLQSIGNYKYKDYIYSSEDIVGVIQHFGLGNKFIGYMTRLSTSDGIPIEINTSETDWLKIKNEISTKILNPTPGPYNGISFQDSQNNIVSLDSLFTKDNILINFSNEGCSPCRNKAVALNNNTVLQSLFNDKDKACSYVTLNANVSELLSRKSGRGGFVASHSYAVKSPSSRSDLSNYLNLGEIVGVPHRSLLHKNGTVIEFPDDNQIIDHCSKASASLGQSTIKQFGYKTFSAGVCKSKSSTPTPTPPTPPTPTPPTPPTPTPPTPTPPTPPTPTPPTPTPPTICTDTKANNYNKPLPCAFNGCLNNQCSLTQSSRDGIGCKTNDDCKSKPKYRCAGNSCIEDSTGSFDTPSCDNKCTVQLGCAGTIPANAIPCSDGPFTKDTTSYAGVSYCSPLTACDRTCMGGYVLQGDKCASTTAGSTASTTAGSTASTTAGSTASTTAGSTASTTAGSTASTSAGTATASTSAGTATASTSAGTATASTSAGTATASTSAGTATASTSAGTATASTSAGTTTGVPGTGNHGSAPGTGGTITGPHVGNGKVESGEACDDGNSKNNDGCDSLGKIESGWYCVGEPSICGTLDCKKHGQWFDSTNASGKCCGGLSSTVSTLSGSSISTTICYDDMIDTPLCRIDQSPSGRYVALSAGTTSQLLKEDVCLHMYQDYASGIMQHITERKEYFAYDDIDYSQVLFSDVGNHRERTAIEALRSYGIVKGRGDSLQFFSPDSRTSRAEFFKMLIRIMYMGTDTFDDSGIGEASTPFLDLGSQHRSAQYIMQAYDDGLLTPLMKNIVEKNLIMPNRSITRDEIVAILLLVKEGQDLSASAIKETLGTASHPTRASIASLFVRKFPSKFTDFFYMYGNEEYYRSISKSLQGKTYREQYDILIKEIDTVEKKKVHNAAETLQQERRRKFLKNLLVR